MEVVHMEKNGFAKSQVKLLVKKNTVFTSNKIKF